MFVLQIKWAAPEYTSAKQGRAFTEACLWGAGAPRMAEADPAAPGPSAAAFDWRAKYEESEAKRKKTAAALVSPHT